MNSAQPKSEGERVQPQPIEFMARAHFLRAEFRRHFLSERERLVAEAILDVSLVYGLGSVMVPKLEVISDLTGIPRPHVHGTLRSLVEMRILTVSEADGAMRYELNADSDTWKVKVRVARETIRRAMELVLELNHGHREAGENFKVLQHTLLKPPTVTDSVTVTREDGEAIIARAKAVLAAVGGAK